MTYESDLANWFIPGQAIFIQTLHDADISLGAQQTADSAMIAAQGMQIAGQASTNAAQTMQLNALLIRMANAEAAATSLTSTVGSQISAISALQAANAGNVADGDLLQLQMTSVIVHVNYVEGVLHTPGLFPALLPGITGPVVPPNPPAIPTHL